MCTPILIASAALAVGSAVANTIASNSQASARNDVLAAERIRQTGYNAETAALNNQSRDRYVNFVPQQDATAARLGDVLATRVNDPNSSAASVLPSSTSAVVNQDTARQEGAAQTYVDQQAGALAKMRSFGDLLGEISTKQGRDAAQIGQIGGFKQASNGLVPLELDNSQHAGDGWHLLGDILGGLGSVGTSAGINGNNFLTDLFAPKAATVGVAAARGVTPFRLSSVGGGAALGVT